MNALKKNLVDDPGAPYFGVWINTWQYSVMSNSEQVVLRILAGIIAQISGCAAATAAESRARLMKSFAKVALISLGNIAGKAAGLGEFGTEIRKACEATVEMSNSPNVAYGVSQIEDLKNQIQKHVDSCVGNEKKGFVFFIDDLDRIDPPVAVQVLELLKNIFDLRNCIFVLAIDYGVVVKGLKPKFGEMSVENEREFRSFFDKIIQLPFSMPVGAYKIEGFLFESLKEIGYLDEKERADSQLCDALTSYALESVGTNPRSLKRLINTLSLIRLLIQKTRTADDDDDFKAWKDVSFALVCLQIQYPQVYSALEQFPDFTAWDERFAQSMRLAAVEDEVVEKLKGMSEFDETWEQMLFRFCRSDAFLEARALNISKMLNRIRARIQGSQELVGEVVESLLSLSAVTSVKGELPKAPEAQTFNKSEFLKRLRDLVFGLKWNKRPSGNYCYERNFRDSTLYMSSWQRRVQSNLLCELWLQTAATEYKCPFLAEPYFHISHDGRSYQLKMWGEVWMRGTEMKFKGVDFVCAEKSGVLQKVEEVFVKVWTAFGGEAKIGHHERNIWYNVTVPFSAKEDLSRDSGFANNYRAAIMKTAEAFALLLPYRISSHA